ncbi:heavy-metal-associated domain-containing protein [Altererythrobacter sp.]|uniref:heavy-metal-associated domain-containing protein n=1 Tax=Altererythrobacter sp. TaxID=1872480 RepID=UPI003D138394
MTPHISLPRLSHTLPSGTSARFGWAFAACLLMGLAVAVWAQVEGDRGIAPVVSSSDIDVGGIEVDVRADSAEEAREKGWKEAHRKAWEKLGGPTISESELQSLVSAVVVENERIGPKRYIARLGVIFDRTRAGRYLGEGARASRSAPMLLLPVTESGGAFTMYEVRNPWQRAWAEFNPGTSRIDYVRPAGAGGDSLLLTYGQTGRRSRTWWRVILDQFGAADVLVPVARLRYTWPGGPVKGEFTARYGPDSRYLDGFTLTADNPRELPVMLEQAVKRFDTIFEQALADGKLRPDPTLNLGGGGDVDPALQRLIEIGRAIQRRDAVEETGEIGPVPGIGTPPPAATPQPSVVNSYVVQFNSPDASAIDSTLAAMRATPGVRGAATTSIAIGGTSVMRISFAGSLDQLAAVLRQRGYTVQEGSGALAISR